MKDLEKAAKKISGEKSFDEIFTPSFMKRYTNFSNFDELLEAGDFVINSQEDFENIPDNEFDEHIRATTQFSSWQKMLDKASDLYAQKAFSKL
ncbi:hypothetical protein Ami103574_04295 [Aminipila butyrica]|uniref:Uncharacterized protein n=2 Tax=Aminipila butyrica TaxID=433296 RepID=A0A858BX72_9FIRM|nr:hypothetical protein Ami103574_04295 [Aminipila butyrica]